VQTDMLAKSGAMREILVSDGALTPEEVAEVAVQGLQDDRFLILPHPEVGNYFRSRAADPDRWLAGMNKLQRHLDSGETR
jgi:hypothetical protein